MNEGSIVRIMRAILFIPLLLFCVQANPVTWYIQGLYYEDAEFGDLGAAQGTFDYTEAGGYSNVSISIAGAILNSIVVPEYSDANVAWFGPSYQLLVFDTALRDEGGTIGIAYSEVRSWPPIGSGRSNCPADAVVCWKAQAGGYVTTSKIAREEILDLAVRMSVDNSTPSVGQPVEFRIMVSNVGGKSISGVIVEEKLPHGLAIPDGLAAFTGSGYYDSTNGLWVIGDIGVGNRIGMTLPAVVMATPRPPCIINTVSLLEPDDASARNNVDSVAVRKPGIERCVDVSISRIDGLGESPLCGDTRAITRRFQIANNGPDEARNVVLSVSETAYRAPGFNLVSPGCSGLQCNWQSIGAGEKKEVQAFSDSFVNNQILEHRVTAAITTTDEDYASENNASEDGRTIYPFTGNCAGIPDYRSGSSFGGLDLSPCFIATAAYGTPFDKRIDILRHFRDHTLANFNAGRIFIDWYYSYSPTLAKYIESRPMLRAVVRALLVPVLLTINYPVAALVACVMCIFLMLNSWRTLNLLRGREGNNSQDDRL